MLIALIVLFGSLIEAHAATRDCTDAERAQADAKLAEIANNSTLRNQLIQQHLRFGTPLATVSTDHERTLVQGGYVMKHDDDLRTTLSVSDRATVTAGLAKDVDAVNQ